MIKEVKLILKGDQKEYSPHTFILLVEVLHGFEINHYVLQLRLQLLLLKDVVLVEFLGHVLVPPLLVLVLHAKHDQVLHDLLQQVLHDVEALQFDLPGYPNAVPQLNH